MGFHVEIVFKLGVVNNDSSYKSHIESLLEKYKISDFYFFNESDYFNNNWHHICVYDITFENNDKSDIHNMIHFFKKLVFLPHIHQKYASCITTQKFYFTRLKPKLTIDVMLTNTQKCPFSVGFFFVVVNL